MRRIPELWNAYQGQHNIALVVVVVVVCLFVYNLSHDLHFPSVG